MKCHCCECDCGREEVQEPEEHDVRFKGHDINVSKDSLSSNWYIRVTHPNGSKLYDGWWRASENATWQEAVDEAKLGAMLMKPKKSAALAAAPKGQP